VVKGVHSSTSVTPADPVEVAKALQRARRGRDHFFSTLPPATRKRDTTRIRWKRIGPQSIFILALTVGGGLCPPSRTIRNLLKCWSGTRSSINTAAVFNPEFSR